MLSCSSSLAFHILPPSRITFGIDASTMTSLGTCRLVIPLRESTIARAGRVAYTAAMSASISAFFSAGSRSSLASTSASPLLTLAPTLLSVSACLSSAVLVKHGDAMAEHDRIGDLHHGGLEVQRQQDAVALRGLDLLGVERAQRGDVHHGRVDHLARQQRQLLLPHGDRAAGGHELDAHVGRLLQRGRRLGAVEVAARHVRDARLRARRGPRLHHPMGVLLRELLDRDGRPAVRVPLAQHRVHGRTEAHREPLLQRPLGVVLRLLGVVGDVVALGLELLDRGPKLRDRRRHVGQLDDVGVRTLGELAEAGEVICDPLCLGQLLGEVGDDPAGKRDVARLHVDARAPRERLHDREQRVTRQCRSFVDLRPDDLGCRHGPPSLRFEIAAWNAAGKCTASPVLCQVAVMARG